MGNSNLIVVFMTGLLTGGLTCLAVQGGLLAATIAQREEERLKEKTKEGNALPILAFLAAKLAAYTILGLLLGWFGTLFQLSPIGTGIMQFAVALFMIGTALSLLNVHPIFRYFVIQPPRKLMRLVRNQSKSKQIFAPAFLGALTIFIPCGTTQAMMALAIASANPLLGAAIMFAFVLGTSPVFFILGYFATTLGELWHKKFLKFAAYAIIALALFNIDGALALTGNTITLRTAAIGFLNLVSFSSDGNNAIASDGDAQQEWTITIGSNGYTPNVLTVAAGEEVTLHLKNDKGYTCAQGFTIPKLGIQKVVPPGTSDTITFTAPGKPGQLAFSCSMGMYRGVINII